MAAFCFQAVSRDTRTSGAMAASGNERSTDCAVVVPDADGVVVAGLAPLGDSDDDLLAPTISTQTNCHGEPQNQLQC